MIRLRVLGPVDLRDDKGNRYRDVLAQPKRLALLVALVVGPPGFRRRDSLLSLLWPELDQAHARAALNQALHFLRRGFSRSADAAILSRGVDEIGINSAAVWCDAMAFREHLESGRHEEALELYRGNLLEGFFVEQGDDFEKWLERERDLLRISAAKAARAVVGIHERGGDLTPAVAAARRAVDLSGDDERVVRELLQLLDRLGDRAGALQAYQEFSRRLETEFGAHPAPETKALIEGIRARVLPGKATAVLPQPVNDYRNTNHALTNGRDDGEVKHNGSEAGVATNASVLRQPSIAQNDRAGERLPLLLMRRSPWVFAGAALGASLARCGG